MDVAMRDASAVDVHGRGTARTAGTAWRGHNHPRRWDGVVNVTAHHPRRLGGAVRPQYAHVGTGHGPTDVVGGYANAKHA